MHLTPATNKQMQQTNNAVKVARKSWSGCYAIAIALPCTATIIAKKYMQKHMSCTHVP